MNDNLLNARKEKMKKSNIRVKVEPCLDFSRAREEFRLNLRKEKLENYFQQKRMKDYNDLSRDYSYDIESFNISVEIKLKMDNLHENDKNEFIYSLLNSNSLDEIKYSLTVYRDSLVREKLSFNNRIFRRICEIMQKSSDYLIINECVWCLINITFMNNDSFIFDVLSSIDLINFYILKLKLPELKENMIILISNLVGGDDKSRRVILSTEIYEDILNIMKEESKFCVFQICMEFLIILFQYSTRQEMSDYFVSKNERIFETSLILKTLVTNTNDDIILSKTLECLVHFTHKFPIHNRFFLNKEFIDYLFHYLQHLKKNYTLKIIGNLTSGNNLIIFDLLKLDLLNYMKKFLNSESFIYKRDIVWVISNICCSTKSCLIELIKSDILRDVKSCFFYGDKLLKKEVLHTFFNLSNFCDKDIANYLEHIGVFEIFKFFCENERNPIEIQMALIGFFNLLQLDDTDFFIYQMNKIGITEKLYTLQNHQNEFITKQVSAIFYLFRRLEEVEVN